MNGYLQFKATNVGNHTMLTNIIEMVKKARMSKAPLQRIADKAVQYFIPIVIAIAIASSLYWIFIVHQSNNGGHSSMSNFVRHISHNITHQFLSFLLGDIKPDYSHDNTHPTGGACI